LFEIIIFRQYLSLAVYCTLLSVVKVTGWPNANPSSRTLR